MVLQPGYKLFGDRYTILKKLGDGGFGITYLAKKSDNTPIVIKTLKDDLLQHRDFKQFQDKFRDEALALALCKHPHIVQIDNFFQENYLPYLAMEYVPGEDLDKRVSCRGILPEGEALNYIQQIGKALSFIHAEKGLLHRDVKPCNIILRHNTQEAVLIDFGLARGFIPNVTQQMTPFYTPYFAPPEQIQPNGQYGEYTDVYALAATLYFLLTNTLPTPAPWRALNGRLQPPGQINPQISKAVQQAIYQGMELEPCKRPPSIDDWLSLLPKVQSVSTIENQLALSFCVTPNLASEKRINYRKLQGLLKAQKWKEADVETARCLLALTAREQMGWLDIRDIQNLPCADLRTIDRLWVKYSQGRFGFSIQAQMYRSLGGTQEYNPETWEKYGKQVGWRKRKHLWRKQNDWLSYFDLTFTSSAPPGHLPKACDVLDWGSWLGWQAALCLFERVEACQCHLYSKPK